jgi:DNA-binding MarR family transcriptional regulator
LSNAKISALGSSPLHVLHRVSQLATEMFSRELGESDLTPRQLVVLLCVAESEGLSQADIVDKTGVDRSTVTDIVRRLQKKGWVQRRRTREDARAYAVKVTEEGHRLLRKATPRVHKVDEEILAALPGGRGEALMDGLAAIITKLEVKNWK